MTESADRWTLTTTGRAARSDSTRAGSGAGGSSMGPGLAAVTTTGVPLVPLLAPPIGTASGGGMDPVATPLAVSSAAKLSGAEVDGGRGTVDPAVPSLSGSSGRSPVSGAW